MQVASSGFEQRDSLSHTMLQHALQQSLLSQKNCDGVLGSLEMAAQVRKLNLERLIRKQDSGEKVHFSLICAAQNHA